MKNKIRFLAMMLIGVLLSVNQVWAETIAYWENQLLTANTPVSATTGSGTLTSSINIKNSGKLVPSGSCPNGSSVELIFSGLSLNGYENIQLRFISRSSDNTHAISVYTSTNGSSYTLLTTTSNLTGTETPYIISNIPSTTTHVKLTFNGNSQASFFFGCPRFLEEESGTYVFDKLTAANTAGWTNSDWDGKYLLVDANSGNALHGGAPGEKSYYHITDVNNTITITDLDPAFQVTYVQGSGYAICGIGVDVYINETGSSGNLGVSYTLSYNSVFNSSQIKGTNYYLRYNSGAFKYYEIQTLGNAITLYKLRESSVTYTDLFSGQKSGHFQPSFLAPS